MMMVADVEAIPFRRIETVDTTRLARALGLVMGAKMPTGIIMILRTDEGFTILTRSTTTLELTLDETEVARFQMMRTRTGP